MAKREFKKIEITALLKDSSELLNRLQRRGVLEITNIEDELLTKIDGSGSAKKYESYIKSAKKAAEILEKYIEKQNSVIGFLKGRTKLNSREFNSKKEDIKKTLKNINEITKSERKIKELEKKISLLYSDIDILTPWENSPIPLDTKETEFVSVIFGTFPNENGKYKELIKTATENKLLIHFEALKTNIEAKMYKTVYFYKEQKDIVFELLKKYGFDIFSYSSSLTANDEIKKLKKEIKACDEIIKREKNKLKALGNIYPDIEFLIDYYTLKEDKYLELKKLAMTKNVVVIKGYIPTIYADGLVREFTEKYPCVINIYDLNEDDNPPVLLYNSKFSTPLEGITEMYALPNKNDVDPSSIMSFFYYLFFGMMLSDAGYGIIITLAMALILKNTNVEGNLRRSFYLFMYSGISTIFWGILFGSWFGDLPQVIAKEFFNKEIPTTALWFEPLDKPITLLLFSFGLGILHLFLGLYVRFKILYDKGRKTDAYCDVIPVFITVLGAAPLGAGILTQVPEFLKTAGLYLLIIGAVSVILTSKRTSKNIFARFFGGIYGLYNVATGYLSDILSYSRLLALGLATGSIASVINLIATMPDNITVKAIMLIFVGFLGHILNLGINLLGAYVHADRLQFVELFSKFYEGGGEAFMPLRANTKYYTFEKENIYE